MSESQMGYQIRSARAAIPGRGWCRSSTSRSLPGSSSRRPYPPTATSATPGSAPSSAASQRSAPAARRARSAANEVRHLALDGRAPVSTASKGSRPALAGADPYHRAHRGGPDLAVADPPRLRGLDHHADQVGGVLVVAEHLKAHLWHQVDLVLRAAVHLGVAALPAITARLTDRHAVHAERLQSGLDLVQLEGLDHGGDELHATTSRDRRCASASPGGVSPTVTDCFRGVKRPGVMLRRCFAAAPRAQVLLAVSSTTARSAAARTLGTGSVRS